MTFDVEDSGAEELRGGDPREQVLENARRKARAVAPDHAGSLILGCDTDVAVDGRALGKPGGDEQAREYLELLSGRGHDVLSGLCLIGPGEGQTREGVARSAVTFRELGARDIDRYLSSGEWRERAGGYALQGLGATLVARVEGDVSNVIGLPISLLLDLAPELLDL